jgi:hypothetical protein
VGKSWMSVPGGERVQSWMGHGCRLDSEVFCAAHHWTLQLLYTSVHIGAWDVSRSLHHLRGPGVGRESQILVQYEPHRAQPRLRIWPAKAPSSESLFGSPLSDYHRLILRFRRVPFHPTLGQCGFQYLLSLELLPHGTTRCEDDRYEGLRYQAAGIGICTCQFSSALPIWSLHSG